MKNKVVRILVGLLCMVMISSAVQMITIAGAADCSDCDCTTEDGCDGGGGGGSDGASDGGSDDGASDGGVSCELCKKIRVPIIDCTTKADSGTNCKIVRWEPVGE